MTGTDLIHRATLEELLGWRERALTMAEEVRQQHDALIASANEAQAVAARAAPGGFGALMKHIEEGDRRTDFATRVRRQMDKQMWRHLLAVTGIEGLMDQQARREFEAQLASDPPEITADTVRATFRQFKTDAHVIFRRGLVNAFVNFDRSYRSHDGFKIGSRIANSYAMSESGSIYTSRELLFDLDRVMHILDGKRVGEGWGSSLYAMLDRSVRGGGFYGITPGVGETEYWRARWYKNRSIHLWPVRKDLVRRANRLIAEHFEDQLGAGPDAAGARRYTRAKPHHHDVEDFYETGADAARRAVTAADIRPSHAVLEPSAGNGALVAEILATGATPDAVERDPDRADTLRDMLPPGAVVQMDFLAMHPEPEYDRVVMNPPWGSGAGVQHVHHALRFLRPGGRLVALLGPGFEQRSDGPTLELRRLIKAWGGRVEGLPRGSFVGTATDAVMIVVDLPAVALPALPAPAPAANDDQSAMSFAAE